MADFGSNFEIKVETETLRAKADTVTGQISEMQGQLDEFKQVVTKTSSYWLGDGGDTRRKEYIDKQAFVEEMIKRLKEYPVDLLKIAGIYDNAEKENIEFSRSLSTDVII